MLLAGEFTLDLDEFEAAFTDKTRVVVLNTPHNPTGKVISHVTASKQPGGGVSSLKLVCRAVAMQAFSREELEGIANVIRKYPNVIVVADEVYDCITFTGGHTRFASLPGMYEAVSVAACASGYTAHLLFGAVHPATVLTFVPVRFERTVTMSSAAKTFSVTGWKIG